MRILFSYKLRCRYGDKRTAAKPWKVREFTFSLFPPPSPFRSISRFSYTRTYMKVALGVSSVREPLEYSPIWDQRIYAARAFPMCSNRAELCLPRSLSLSLALLKLHTHVRSTLHKSLHTHQSACLYIKANMQTEQTSSNVCYGKTIDWKWTNREMDRRIWTCSSGSF